MSVFREINMILSSTLNNPPPSELMIKLFCPVIKLGKDQGQSGYRDMGVTVGWRTKAKNPVIKPSF